MKHIQRVYPNFKETQMLQKLKSFDPAQYTIEEMVELLALANGMAAVYVQQTGELPEWLANSKSKLEKELSARHRDMLEQQAKELEASLETLKSKEEKRSDTEKRLAAVRAKLNPGPKAVSQA